MTYDICIRDYGVMTFEATDHEIDEQGVRLTDNTGRGFPKLVVFVPHQALLYVAPVSQAEH